jgi:flagellar hook-basal body complex protein FliE
MRTTSRHHSWGAARSIGSMDMKLKPFDFAKAASSAGMADVAQRVQAKARLEGTQGASATAPTTKVEPSFQVTFSRALTDISKSQQVATNMQREVQFDNPNVSLEETMVAMQKAQLGFQSAVQFRNKLVQAYTDIMNMQV